MTNLIGQGAKGAGGGDGTNGTNGGDGVLGGAGSESWTGSTTDGSPRGHNHDLDADTPTAYAADPAHALVQLGVGQRPGVVDDGGAVGVHARGVLQRPGQRRLAHQRSRNLGSTSRVNCSSARSRTSSAAWER